MKTELYWFSNERTNGRLGICSRPRGNDWLEDELQHFKASGVDILVSALEYDEQFELELLEESLLCGQIGMIYLSYPIADRQTPSSMKSFYGFTKELSVELLNGNNVMVHCRQGIGRSSLLVSGILRHLWSESASEIFSFISSYRGRTIPDTEEQILWLQKWIDIFF